MNSQLYQPTPDIFVFPCLGRDSFLTRFTLPGKSRNFGVSRKSIHSSRFAPNGFTLLELVLALALIVVATSLIGSLLSLYARSFATRGEDVRRKQLATSLLAMIADDIRSVVVQQQYDKSVFAQLFGTEEMDLEGFSMTEDAASSLGLGEPDSSAAENTGGTGTGSFDANASLSNSLNSSVPTGIYGNQNQLMIDVSRVPRIEEFLAMQMNMGQVLPGSLVDVPGDMKRVTYYVQAPSPMGVQDVVTQVESGMDTSTQSAGMNGGLVRRQLERAVTNFAEENGLANQLMAVGDLIAPEVVSLEFAFFDGVQWTYQWDSSQMGLPWLINITLALQSATGAEKNIAATGMSLQAIDRQQLQDLGIEVFELTVAIPGAQLQPKPTLTDQETGMGTLGI